MTDAEEWFRKEFGDNEGPFYIDQMIMAYEAGDSNGYGRGYSEGENPDDI